MRLIDADSLNGLRFTGIRDEDGNLLVPFRDVVRMLSHAPTVDAVEVVRCKDCKYSGVVENYLAGGCEKVTYCNIGLNPQIVTGTHFCGYGKRKETGR